MIGAAVFAALVALPLGAETNINTATVDLTPQLQRSGLQIDQLRGIEVGGIVILRGKAMDTATAKQAGAYVKQLGYTRVANLIEVVLRPDDETIERTAERRLAMQGSLEGCRLRVDSDHGSVTIAGDVKTYAQRDLALDVVRKIDGVRSVHGSFGD